MVGGMLAQVVFDLTFVAKDTVNQQVLAAASLLAVGFVTIGLFVLVREYRHNRRIRCLAYHDSKQDGRGGYRLCDESMDAVFGERVMLETGLQRALANHEFYLVYQPRVDVQTRSMTSAEALLRWHHPVSGLISPGVFIPIAEKSGLIVEIGMWVLEQVCEQIRSWQEAGLAPVRIAVNVSPLQLLAPRFVKQVQEILERTQVNPSFLEIEVTEGAFIDHQGDVIEKLKWLRFLGIPVSIDDFGTGYSSLARLKHLPVDTLKIDQAFVREMHDDKGAVARTIIALGHDLESYISSLLS